MPPLWMQLQLGLPGIIKICGWNDWRILRQKAIRC